MMASRSCGNFFDLASEELLNVPRTPRGLPKVMTLPGIISDGNGNSDAESDSTSSVCRERKIIVANMLPLHAQKDNGTGKWIFSLDEDSILLQLKDGFTHDTEVIYVGSLKVEIEAKVQEEIAQRLLDDFNCVPTFLPQDIHKKFYHGFCKQQLWPLFHYMLPMCPDHGDRFDRQLWQAYVSANKSFADKVMEVVNPEDDFIWIHDYHLMVLPTFLRKRYNRIKLGLLTLSPYHSERFLLSPTALAGLVTMLHACLDMKAIILGKYHYVLYFLVLAMQPRMLMTVDENLKPLSVPVRVGQAVDVVGQAGRPKTITGFQTHSTPVLLSAGDRAELATEKYIPLSPILEGFVILKENPEYKDEH